MLKKYGVALRRRRNTELQVIDDVMTHLILLGYNNMSTLIRHQYDTTSTNV